MGCLVPIEIQAERIARRQHDGQTRWDKFVPYIVHPERVAKTQIGAEFKAAAWLHDVIEDTPMTLDELRDELELMCGKGHSVDLVISLVDALTRRKGESYLEFLGRLKGQGPGAIELKLADIDDNLADNMRGAKKGATTAKYELAKWFLCHDCHRTLFG